MIRVIVSDTSNGDHAQAVKAAISSGYGSDISDQIVIITGYLFNALQYAKNNGAVMVVRSTTGASSYHSSAMEYYPDIQVFMPLGSNDFEQVSSTAGVIIMSGAGDAENRNNTGYGTGLEFWDNDLETSVSNDFSSYSNGVVAGKMLKIKDTLDCSWWEARYRARMTCDKGEDNRVDSGKDLFNGYGKINVNNAIAYNGTIIKDPFTEEEPTVQDEPQGEEEEQITNNIIMAQNFYIDVAKENIDNIIRLFRGDTHTLNIYIKNNGEIFNLSGYTAILSAKENETDTEYSIQLYGGDVAYGTGVLTFTFSNSDTEELDAGEYVYDVQITNGSNTYTILSDILDLKADITRDNLQYNLITDDYEVQLITEDSKYLLTENTV